MGKGESILPSRKFIISVTIVAVVIAAAVFVPDMVRKERFTKDLEETNESKVSVQVTADEILTNDADRDGLEDWEEALWGTDPLNPDSDSNGVLDSEEIARVRENIAITGSAPDVEVGVEDQIAREFYTAISILDRSDALGQEEIQLLGEGLAGRVTQITTTTYTTNDITIVPNTTSALDTYSSELFDTVNKYPLQPSDIDPVVAVLDGDTNTAALLPIAAKFNLYADELLAMSVVPDNVEFHVGFLNTIRAYAQTVERIANFEEEPIVAMKSASDFEVVLDELVLAFQTLIEAIDAL
jgi:hypothetical protein